jgi:hypothetical protein
MIETTSGARLSVMRLILVPSVITLAVTILRLVGELQHWSNRLFSPSPGGGAAVIGIVWLVPIFGIYFALKLSAAGARPAGAGRPIVYAILGLLVMAAGGYLGFASKLEFPGKPVVGLALVAAGGLLPLGGWPVLGKTLLAYGFAARIPVAIVYFLAIRGHWGTHYDALPPGYRETDFWTTYLQIGLLPQLVFWVAFTAVIGTLLGSIAVAVLHRRKPVLQATS